jgi:hypothetical protein
MQVEVVSRTYASGRIDSYAGKGCQASRITGTGGIYTGGGFVFESGLFVVGSLARSVDKVLEDVGNLLCAFRRACVVDALVWSARIIQHTGRGRWLTLRLLAKYFSRTSGRLSI